MPRSSGSFREVVGGLVENFLVGGWLAGSFENDLLSDLILTSAGQLLALLV